MRRWSLKATVGEIPAGNDPGARSVVVDELACSPMWPSTPEQKEVAGLATTVNAYQVLCEANEAIAERQRFISEGVDLAIRHIGKWPAVNPEFYELTLEGNV